MFGMSKSGSYTLSISNIHIINALWYGSDVAVEYQRVVVVLLAGSAVLLLFCWRVPLEQLIVLFIASALTWLRPSKNFPLLARGNHVCLLCLYGGPKGKLRCGFSDNIYEQLAPVSGAGQFALELGPYQAHNGTKSYRIRCTAAIFIGYVHPL